MGRNNIICHCRLIFSKINRTFFRTSMSLKKNTFSNFIGFFYTALIGLIILPLYLKYLGISAFGLIGLFTVLKAWFRAFDLSLIPTFSREVAFNRNNATGIYEIRLLMRSLEVLFFIVNILIIFTAILSCKWIVHSWLQIENIDYAQAAFSIILMIIIISVGWFSDLYRAVIQGMEDQVWLNVANIFILSLQYIGGLILLRWFTHNPVHYFEYQLMIAVVDVFLVRTKAYRLIPNASDHKYIYFSWNAIKRILLFASSLAYTGTLWLLLTQLDKLLLSHILPLSKYGYFILVALISGGILQFSAPISQAILPRMTFLLSQGKKEEMLQLYCNATQITAVLVFSLSGIIAVFGRELIYAWTGNIIAAHWIAPILFWYALGNAVCTMQSFQYYLQCASGNLRLHVVFYTIFSIIAVPSIFFAAYFYGPIGTGIAWLLIQCTIFVGWSPIVHRKYAPGIHRVWILRDIMSIFLAVTITLFCLRMVFIHFEWMSRIEVFIILCGFGIVVLMGGALASSACRNFFAPTFGKKEVLKV